MEGAVRSGKTFLGILYWDAIVSKHKNKLFIMTGHTISSLKRNVLNDIEKLFGVSTHLNANNEFELYGNRIACFGSDKSDSFKSMRGLTAHGWYANEVILSHQNSILEAFARCSGDGAKIVWETNPDKPTHYVKTNYIDKSGQKFKDGSYNVMSYHFELYDNDRLEQNYIESLEASIPKGTVYDRQIKGLWKATDKAIITNFDIVQGVPAGRVDEYCYGLDFGFNNPSAMVRTSWVDGEIYAEGLFHKSKLITTELVDMVKLHVNDNRVPIYCDNAEPDKIEAIRRAGFNAQKAKKEVLPGINKMKGYKIHLVDGDIDLKRSVENYEFRSNAAGEVLEEPVKFDDHYCLVDSTLVKTLYGEKKIKDLCKYDYVLTRKGFKQVVNVFDRGFKRVVKYNIYGNILHATKDHRVITRNNKKELQSLTLCDTVYLINDKEYCKCQKYAKKLSCITGLSLDVIQSQKEEQIECIINALPSSMQRGLDTYISINTNKKEELSQRGGMYIIKMITRLIIDLKTFCWLVRVTIGKSITKNRVKSLKKRLDKTLIRLEKKQVNGIVLRQGLSGIKNTLESKTLDFTEKIRFVKCVLKSMWLKSKDKDFVAQHVSQEDTGETKKVYDITVKDEHEFYANNVLVSNCDALRYAIYTHNHGFKSIDDNIEIISFNNDFEV